MMNESPLLSSLFPNTFQVMEQALDSRLFPGAVVGIWQNQPQRHMFLQSWGNRTEVPSPLPLRIDTPFDLASLSKVLATTALTARLVDRGWISWNTPLVHLLPDFTSPHVLIRHLLSHTAGLAAWKPFWKDLRDEFSPQSLFSVPILKRQKAMRKLLCAEVPEQPVETRALYSDLSFLLLGFALEELTQLTLPQAVKRWVWDPMEIEGLQFHPVLNHPSRQVLPEVAATEDCSWRGGILQGQVHDDNCWAMGGYGGHAGVFGRARDILSFVDQLMNGFYAPSTLQGLLHPVSQPLGCTRTLGWDTPTPGASSAGQFFSPFSIGHLGFTGTSLWIDLEAQLAVTVLTQRVHPQRDRSDLKAFRPAIHDAIRLDLRKQV